MQYTRTSETQTENPIQLDPTMNRVTNQSKGLVIKGHWTTACTRILTKKARLFITELEKRFGEYRRELLAVRVERQIEIDKGVMPNFLPETQSVRDGAWKVGPVPGDLRDRRVEITGPVDRKMIINALNSPVKVFMADFEDSSSPTWDNIIEGQVNLRDAVRRKITFTNPENGKYYKLNDQTATLMVRPRGWHLEEKNVELDGKPISASLFDFGLYFFHNAKELPKHNTGPYFYLPKLESHLEARLWNDVFVFAQESLGISKGTIKATVLIETILAAFEMDEILYELKDHSAGLNCGRWDYIFSFIKKFKNNADFILPDRGNVTMDRHFLKSYVNLLIQTCHKRGAHAMGGMAAQIPIKGDEGANTEAMDKVRLDKEREMKAGHDGTWIAHPGLASIAMEAFSGMKNANQVETLQQKDVNITAEDLLKVPVGDITEAAVRHNIRVGIQYIEAWLRGNGCVPLYHLMEDAATAEICRAQLWQWVHLKATTKDGDTITGDKIEKWITEELEQIKLEIGLDNYFSGRFDIATDLFTNMIETEHFDEFLTLKAYQYI
ncbi:MAG: malate synthase A [Candidatus Marinimicrobia bacterium]|jgi:malate synthase|nr:malate synthase A [Candidatus Neomarinimicrobiota bacterium]MDP6611869.1 malate synthase A [Candidatus Neomarinimicrobiota bacterium]|tara:strand:- start:2636 stop:4294 length:1659 start_codon:yes stop_codon:yes gene_type:complete